MAASYTPRALRAGEEGSAAQGATDELTAAPTWMVEPLDGTTNFVHRQPNVCVSIGLAVDQQVRQALPCFWQAVEASSGAAQRARVLVVSV